MFYFFKYILLLLYFIQLSVYYVFKILLFPGPQKSQWTLLNKMYGINSFISSLYISPGSRQKAMIWQLPWGQCWGLWSVRWTQNSRTDGFVEMGTKNTWVNTELQVTKLWQMHRKEVIMALFLFILSHFMGYKDTELEGKVLKDLSNSIVGFTVQRSLFSTLVLKIWVWGRKLDMWK